MRKLQRLGALVLLGGFLAGVIMPFQTVQAAVGGRPAEPDPDNPRTQSIFIYTLNGGETKKDKIFLSNASDDAETVEIYPVDGVVTNTGSYTCKQQVEDRLGVGSWVRLAENEVTVPARGNVTVDFTVVVPEGVDVGEHNGCIAIQRKSDDGEVSGSIRVKTRQAVRMAIIVPGDIHREVTIEKYAVINGEKNRQHDITLKNIGNVSADVDITLSMKDMFGNEVYRNGGQYVVIANEKLQLLFDDKTQPFFGGWYTATAHIAYDKRAGVFGTPDDTQLVTATSKPVTIFILPSIWAFLLLGFLLLLIASFISWRRRERKAARRAAARSLGKNTAGSWAKYTVRQGDTLPSVAAKYSTTAAKLATLNKLSSSASLKVGSVIYVPKK